LDIFRIVSGRNKLERNTQEEADNENGAWMHFGAIFWNFFF
jgi:hypothetical protein